MAGLHSPEREIEDGLDSQLDRSFQAGLHGAEEGGPGSLGTDMGGG